MRAGVAFAAGNTRGAAAGLEIIRKPGRAAGATQVCPGRMRHLRVKLLQLERGPQDEEIQGQDIRYQQVSNFFSRYGAQGLDTVAEMIARRDTQRFVGSLGKPLAHFHAAALEDACICKGKTNLFRSMCKGLTLQSKGRSTWHACPKPIDTLGNWFAHAMEESFPDRRRTLLVQGGAGSGKSTLANMVLMMYPPFFISTAAWGDTFTWGDMREETLAVELADMRKGALHAAIGCNYLEQKCSRKLHAVPP
jgi:hypothetical protein